MAERTVCPILNCLEPGITLPVNCKIQDGAF
jgi:hypothetical protein